MQQLGTDYCIFGPYICNFLDCARRQERAVAAAIPVVLHNGRSGSDGETGCRRCRRVQALCIVRVLVAAVKHVSRFGCWNEWVCTVQRASRGGGLDQEGATVKPAESATALARSPGAPSCASPTWKLHPTTTVLLDDTEHLSSTLNKLLAHQAWKA